MDASRSVNEPRRALLVGAGAVGQAYGWHLQQAGYEIAFFIKPHHREGLAAGVRVHCHNGSAKGTHDFRGFGLFDSPDALAGHHWDEIWLCMSSTALRGPWLDGLLSVVGDGTVVMLQPGLEDRAYLLERLSEDRLVCGLISLVSYMAPLPGEARLPGMSWWFPPLSPSPFSGDAERVSPLVRALKKGGCPAQVVSDVRGTMAFASALFMPVIAALEVAEWSLSRLRKTEALLLASRGGFQASALAAPGRRRWLAWLISRPWFLAMLLRIAPRFVPFDLETYLRVHFTKVGDQTRAMLQLYCELAQPDRPHDALADLSNSLGS